VVSSSSTKEGRLSSLTKEIKAERLKKEVVGEDLLPLMRPTCCIRPAQFRRFLFSEMEVGRETQRA